MKKEKKIFKVKNIHEQVEGKSNSLNSLSRSSRLECNVLINARKFFIQTECIKHYSIIFVRCSV